MFQWGESKQQLTISHMTTHIGMIRLNNNLYVKKITPKNVKKNIDVFWSGFISTSIDTTAGIAECPFN